MHDTSHKASFPAQAYQYSYSKTALSVSVSIEEEELNYMHGCHCMYAQFTVINSDLHCCKHMIVCSAALIITLEPASHGSMWWRVWCAAVQILLRFSLFLRRTTSERFAAECFRRGVGSCGGDFWYEIQTRRRGLALKRDLAGRHLAAQLSWGYRADQ